MFWPALRAVAFFIGTVIGAGIFALPAVSARAGFPIAATWLVVLTFLLLVVHLMYGEVILRTPERHRLPGYARWYLGKWGWRWGIASAFIGSMGGLLIYLVLLAQFLKHIFPHTNSGDFIPVLIVWAALTGAVIAGLRTVAKVEFLMSLFLFASITTIIVFGLTRFHADFLYARGAVRDAMLPYGAFLFALSGSIAVPEIRDFFTRRTPWFRRCIIVGTLLPALLYGLFIVAIIGAFGPAVSEDLFVSLAPFGIAIQYVLALLGFVAIASSFLAISSYFVDTLSYDVRLQRVTAVACLFLPLVLFLFVTQNFVLLVSLVGTMLGFTDSMLILLVWERARSRGVGDPWYRIMLPAKAAYVMMGVLLVGTVVAFSTMV